MFEITELQGFPYCYNGLCDSVVPLDFSAPLVNLAVSLERDIKKFILCKVKHPIDTEDIYQDTILMLATRKIELEPDASFKRYIFGCANIAVKRYFSAKSQDNKVMILMEDSKLNLPDIKSDIAAQLIQEEYSDDEIIQQLDNLEGKRYKYGCDIYLILYVRLLNLQTGLKDYIHTISLITGEDKKQLTMTYSALMQDEEFMEILSMLLSSKHPLTLLEKYVYCHNKIKGMLKVL